VLEAWNRLTLRMAYNATYPGVQDELGFFRARESQIRLRGPYPASVADRRAPSLAQQLIDPTIDLDGTPSDVPDQIVHIACHCEASHDEPAQSRYVLADEKREELPVMRDALGEEVMRCPPGGEGESPKPLVFLNACGTAPMDPASAASLTRPFHVNENRGIVGTATNIPDRVAAEMSRWFYTELLQGATVADALHTAKWRLLREHGNPLGMLYSIHAYAGIHVAPVPVVPGQRTERTARDEVST
jgi:hypothetical protein